MWSNQTFYLLYQGLRMNRTLLSLNLGSNLIGDNGASKLAEVGIERNPLHPWLYLAYDRIKITIHG